MGSSLRYETPVTPTTAHITAASRPHSTSPPPAKKQRMTLTQTYRLAHRARGKLSTEASRGDHDLRLLVGHANLLDGLMIELQDAEREQDAWFEQSVSTPTKPASEPKHVQWTPSVTEQHQLDVPDASDDSDSDGSEDEEERTPVMKQTTTRRQRAISPPAKPLSSYAIYDDEEEDDIMADDDESEDLSLALTRTRSHSVIETECPELVHGDSSDSSDSSEGEDSDDEMAQVDLKTSPSSHDLAAANVIVKDFAAQHQQKQQKEMHEQMEEDGFYLPQQQQQPPQPMVAAC